MNTKEISLKDAVLFAYEQGLFTVEDADNYGCYGIHCEFHGFAPNGFYTFRDAEDYSSTFAFLYTHSKEEIAFSITETIQGFIEDEIFTEEAYCYLYDMLQLCIKHEKIEYINVIETWIDKAETVMGRE